METRLKPKVSLGRHQSVSLESSPVGLKPSWSCDRWRGWWMFHRARVKFTRQQQRDRRGKLIGEQIRRRKGCKQTAGRIPTVTVARLFPLFASLRAEVFTAEESGPTIDDIERKRERGARGPARQDVPVSRCQHVAGYLFHRTHDLPKGTGWSRSLGAVIHAVAHSGHVFGRGHSPFTQEVHWDPDWVTFKDTIVDNSLMLLQSKQFVFRSRWSEPSAQAPWVNPCL